MAPSGVGIEVDRVKKRLGVNQALDGVSAVFKPGTIHGLIGPEGAGKTTLLRTLFGLLAPNEGSVKFENDGQPVEFKSIRSRMAYMPQTQSLYPDLSVKEHLEFFRDLYRIPREVYVKRSHELLAITRLDKFQGRQARQLSGGMYKKLGLMCALLQSPNVIMLDEPTNGVDPISRREFWELLYRLVEEKILIIVATAYMDEAERCGEVHLLASGKFIAQGEPRAILEQEKAPNFDALFMRLARRGAES